MRAALRFIVPIGLAVLWTATIVVWARSYWRVDKAWVQVLPKVTAEARLTPGRITFGSTRSSVPLPIGDSHWFSWPVESYYAEYIPPPSDTLLSDFRIYNGTVTIPLWSLALASGLAIVAVYMRPLVRTSTLLTLRRAAAPRAAVTTGIATGSLLLPTHPLIAVGPAAPDAQAASVLQVVS